MESTRTLHRRESASQDRAVEAGFDATERGINIATRLDEWQLAGDERKIDLVQLTRDLMTRMTRDLDTRLEWAAVAHSKHRSRPVYPAAWVSHAIRYRRSSAP
jgi:hypothetical protein